MYEVDVTVTLRLEASNDALAMVLAADEIRRAWEGDDSAVDVEIVDILVKSEAVRTV